MSKKNNHLLIGAERLRLLFLQIWARHSIRRRILLRTINIYTMCIINTFLNSIRISYFKVDKKKIDLSRSSKVFWEGTGSRKSRNTLAPYKLCPICCIDWFDFILFWNVFRTFKPWALREFEKSKRHTAWKH